MDFSHSYFMTSITLMCGDTFPMCLLWKGKGSINVLYYVRTVTKRCIIHVQIYLNLFMILKLYFINWQFRRCLMEQLPFYFYKSTLMIFYHYQRLGLMILYSLQSPSIFFKLFLNDKIGTPRLYTSQYIKSSNLHTR